MQRKVTLVVLMTVFFLASALAFGQKEKLKGIISGRSGDVLTVTGADGTTSKVVITDDTKTVDKKGLFGLEKKHLSHVVLIPGLKVSVEGTTDDQGRVVANKITTDGDDLETAQMIQAGLHPTAEQVSANTQRLGAHSAELAAQKLRTALRARGGTSVPCQPIRTT